MSTLADTEALARDAVARLCRAPRVALDVEGDGLFRYKAQLCTVQLCAGDDLAVIDTLCTDPKLLAPLVESDSVEKIVHDASFDVRLLRDAGVTFGRLFDTSVAARFLGEPATGLASLLGKYLDVKLKKEKQHADWGKRPIDDEGLTYLENDVVHLEALAELLEEQMIEKGIVLEVAEESAWVVANAFNGVVDDRAAWVRIKGGLDLSAPDQAILREVAAVREAAAAQMNVPPFKVVRNDVLFDLVKHKPKDQRQAAKIQGLSRGRARRVARELVAAVRRGISAKAPPLDELPAPGTKPPADVREKRKRLQKALTKWRKKAAESRKVDPQAVLPGHCIHDIVACAPEGTDALIATPGFGEFRAERYGEAILKLLRT